MPSNPTAKTINNLPARTASLPAPTLRSTLRRVVSPLRIRSHRVPLPAIRRLRVQRSSGRCHATAVPSSQSIRLDMHEPDPTYSQALCRLARIHNLVPSVLLVFLGAWAGTGRTMLCLGHALSSLSVWVMSMVSGGVAVASVIINDYFDFSSGIDVQNSPDKPLPSGQIKPDAAVLLSLALYTTALISASLLEPRTVRIIVAWSAGLTLLYTPLLKRVTGVKNLVVATIIAASPLSGALAAGADGRGLQAVVATCVWAFLGVLHREVLMDITDVQGDAKAGVLTMPVMWGRSIALGIATCCMAGAAAFGCYQAVKGSGLAWMWQLHGISEGMVRMFAVCGVMAAALPPLLGCRNVAISGYDASTTSRVIDSSLVHIALGMLLMAVLT